MAFTLALSDRHDLQIVNGQFVKVAKAEEVKQRIYVTLRHYYQEYFLNVPAGVPWYEYILGSKDKRSVELILRRIILNVPGVVSVVSLRTVLADRTLDMFADVEVSDGNTVSVRVNQ